MPYSLHNARCQSYENQRKNITKMHRMPNFFPYLVMRKYYKLKGTREKKTISFSSFDLITLFASFVASHSKHNKHRHAQCISCYVKEYKYVIFLLLLMFWRMRQTKKQFKLKNIDFDVSLCVFFPLYFAY